MKITTHEAAGNQIPPQPMKEFWRDQQEYGEGLAETAKFKLGCIAAREWLDTQTANRQALIKAAESQGVIDESL